MRSKPVISLNSRMIVKHRGKTPIYKRTNEIMKRRASNIKKLQQKIKRHQQDQESDDK